MGATKPQATSAAAIPLAERSTANLLELRSIYYAEIESARYTMASWDAQVQKLATVARYRKLIAEIDAELDMRRQEPLEDYLK